MTEDYTREWADSVLEQLPDYFTRAQFCQVQNLLSKNYLAKLHKEGRGPAQGKIGRRVVFKKEDMRHWLLTRDGGGS